MSYTFVADERANQISGALANKHFCFGVRRYVGAGKVAEVA
jgi:hypothetical protein